MPEAGDRVAHPEQARRHGALQRFRRAEICEARGDRAGRHTVLYQRHRDGVENDRLLLARQAPLQLEKGDVAQRKLPDQVLDEVVSAHDDAIGRTPAYFGLELFGHWRLTVSLVL